MDCNNARLLLEFLRPGPDELSCEDAACLEQHLAGCPACRTLNETRERFDAGVGQAMIAVEVPEGLRTRLMTRLDAVRDAWYRRLLGRCAAVAACIALAIGLGWYWRTNWLPGVDLGGTAEFVSSQVGQPQSEVEMWLQDVGGKHLSTPPDFRYELLQKRELTELQGRQVPSLLFVRADRGTTYYAQVYVLSDTRFNLASVPTDARIAGVSGANLRVDTHPTNTRVRYLIVYTGDLGSFKRRPDAQV